MFLETGMKTSYGVFLVGMIVSIVLGMMVSSHLGHSEHLMYGLISDDVFDKLISLYFFIVLITFFFGGVLFLFEKGMQENPLDLEQRIMYPKTKKRLTRSNPTM